jgi:hypothetical protein
MPTSGNAEAYFPSCYFSSRGAGALRHYEMRKSPPPSADLERISDCRVYLAISMDDLVRAKRSNMQL